MNGPVLTSIATKSPLCSSSHVFGDEFVIHQELQKLWLFENSICFCKDLIISDIPVKYSDGNHFLFKIDCSRLI